MKKVNDSLTEEELIVLRDKGTERAFSGKFDSFYEDGTYKCKNCGQEPVSYTHLRAHET